MYGAYKVHEYACSRVRKRTCVHNDDCTSVIVHMQNLHPWLSKMSPVKILFVLRFYGPVNPMGSCRAQSVYLTAHILGRLSPLRG